MDIKMVHDHYQSLHDPFLKMDKISALPKENGVSSMINMSRSEETSGFIKASLSTLKLEGVCPDQRIFATPKVECPTLLRISLKGQVTSSQDLRLLESAKLH